ncbi:hypothetical protein FHG87_006137 [Trinorchestia longiramus]|nr:hypothetical protein FHG87_006137 [Trinorchestia longiramus]
MCLLMVVLMLSTAAAFKDDEPIYKWSPLWFNRFYGRGRNLYKRIREEDPDLRWNYDSFFGYPDYFFNKRSTSEGKCMKENAPCSYVTRNSNKVVMLRCCGALRCLHTGLMHVCTNLQSLLEVEYEE